MPAASVAQGGQSPAQDCPRRIILPVNNGHLYALNADTGARCDSFADKGDLNLQANMPVTTAGEYEPTSPPVVTDKVIIVAGAVTDNYSDHEPSGVIRGFDVATGALLWAFDPGNAEPNAIPADGKNYVANSPNSWAPAAYDPQLDIVYLPIGVATPDIWGGNRTPEMERFASGILALNATSGKLVWFYQTVHHDLWDMFPPSRRWLILPISRGKRFRQSMRRPRRVIFSCWIDVPVRRLFRRRSGRFRKGRPRGIMFHRRSLSLI